HFGGRQRAEFTGIHKTGVAHQADQKPAANKSSAPVVSTSLLIGEAGTEITPSFAATTQPFSLRVTTPSLVSFCTCFSAVSKSEVWYSECSSASFAKMRSTVP